MIGLVLALLYMRRVEKKEADGLYYDSQQGPIFYKIDGQKGPVVVLIHGLGASTYCWRKVIPNLAKHYRVITFDLWGFGHSSKQLQKPITLDREVAVIHELLDHLKVRRYHVIGHSMGGQIGLWLKLTDDRVEKCVAVTPSSHPNLVSDWLHRFAWVAKLTPLVFSPQVMRRILLRSLEDPAEVTEEMVYSYYSPYIDPAAHLTFAGALDIIRDPRVWQRLEELNEDVTVIFAAHDLVINRKVVKQMIGRLHGPTIITHPWSGHLPMEDDPYWLVEQLVLTLKQE
jgi:pimeloyl-ACP methyl ester carboxylesterase